MTKSLILKLSVVFFVSIFLTGCLTVEKKHYEYTLNADGSGSGKIVYENIVSSKDEEKDVSITDFAELMDGYMNGDRFESDNPNFTVTGKNLYEKNGQLWGEVTFTFANAMDAGILFEKDCNCTPVYVNISDFSEEFDTSNSGVFLGAESKINLIKYPSGTKKIEFSTYVQRDLENTVTLLKLYNASK